MSEDCPKCPPGIPAWVMTFADLMSLLLAFFVLLFSFSELDKLTYKQIAGSMKMAFGVQRDIKVKEPPKGINIIAKEFSPGRPLPTPYNEVRQITTDDHHREPLFTDPASPEQDNKTQTEKLNSLGDDHEKIKQPLTDEIEKEERIRRLEKDKERIRKALADEILHRLQIDRNKIRQALAQEIKGGLIEVKIEDGKIVIRIREKGSFDSGSAQPIKSFKKVVGKISKSLVDVKGQIVVSGHTDNIPIHTVRFRSNWELSASRSVTVVHELIKDARLKKERFQIVAYADTRPLDSNHTTRGRAKNRRVEITLNYDNNKDDPGSKTLPGTLTPRKSETKTHTPSVINNKSLTKVKHQSKTG